MLYIIQVSIYSLVMWLLYVTFLRNKAMHAFNRAYLLAAVILPIVLPFAVLPEVWLQQIGLSSTISYTLPEMLVSSGVSMRSTTGFSWASIFIYSYIAVATVLFVVQIIKLQKLLVVIRKSEKEQQGNYILLKNTDYGPGSWGKYIFLPGSEQDEAIIAHEYAHIKYKHTADILFLSLMQIVFWPNIFISFIRKELIQVHEFQADSSVDMNGDDYSKLLLSSVFSTCTLPLSHSFIIHPIKRRIMMLQNKHRPNRALRVLTILSLVAFVGAATAFQSCEQKQAEVQVITQKEMSKLTKMPECEVPLVEFYMQEVKYPKEAKEQNIEGKVVVKFVVNENGEAVSIAVATKDANPVLAQAALDAMKKMPSWTPGEINGAPVSVEMYMPFVFKMDKAENGGNPPPPPPPPSPIEELEVPSSKHA